MSSSCSSFMLMAGNSTYSTFTSCYFGLVSSSMKIVSLVIIVDKFNLNEKCSLISLGSSIFTRLRGYSYTIRGSAGSLFFYFL